MSFSLKILFPSLVLLVACEGTDRYQSGSMDQSLFGQEQIALSHPSDVVVGQPISAIDWFNSAAQQGLSIEDMLELRSAEYRAMIRDAQVQGAIGGALRGGLLGTILLGGSEGALFGAIIGSGVGAATSEYVASVLIQEHQDYLIRRWSLENLAQAASVDTESSRLDLLWNI